MDSMTPTPKVMRAPPADLAERPAAMAREAEKPPRDLGADFDRVARAERIARRLDSAFRVPFTRISLGWDSLLGLIPGVGDTAALVPSLMILNHARKTGAPNTMLVRMAANLGIDWVIGLVPFVGDLFDIGYKANLRNAALIRAHVEVKHGTQQS